MALIGAHVIICSTDPEADRAFFREVLRLPNVDVGEGWLIFGLPPSEVAVHPSDENGVHEFYLLCDDIDDFLRVMRRRGIRCSRVRELDWGRLAELTLPGGGALGVYEPKHARPKALRSRVPPSARSARARRPPPRKARRKRSRR